MISKFKDKYCNMSEVAKAGIWFTICGFIQKALGFITVPIFTRLLTTQQYGTVSIFYSWESILVVFCTLNLFSGVFNNGMINYENDREGFLSSMQGLVTSLSIGICFIYLIFHRWLNSLFELGTLLMLIMFVEILFNSALSFWSAKERFEFRYKKMVMVTLMVAIIGPLLAFCMILLLPEEYGANARIIGTALVNVLICGIIYVINFLKGKKYFDKKYWAYALKFNIPLIPHYLSTLLLAQSDRLMISKISGMAQAGIYGLSHNLAMILNVLTTSVNNAFAPWLYQKLKAEDYKEIPKVSNKLFVLIAISLGLLMAFAPEVIMILAPGDYYEAVYVIPPLAVSLYFMFMFQIYANVEFYFEENKFIMYASVSSAIFNVILNYIFIKLFGYLAAGYTTLICYMILGIAHYIFMNNTVKKYINNDIKLFDIKSTIIFAMFLLLFSIGMLLLYKAIIIRYLIIILILIFIVANKNKVLSIIKEL